MKLLPLLLLLLTAWLTLTLADRADHGLERTATTVSRWQAGYERNYVEVGVVIWTVGR